MEFVQKDKEKSSVSDSVEIFEMLRNNHEKVSITNRIFFFKLGLTYYLLIPLPKNVIVNLSF